MQITKKLLSIDKRRKPYSSEELLKLPFGRHFTNHMLTMHYKENLGWINCEIKPYQAFQLDPSINVLHYGQTVFEGQKAYKAKDGTILLFGPEENAARFSRSLKRMCMPELPVDMYLQGLYELLKTEADWVPTIKGSALYIRPTAIGITPSIDVRHSEEFLFFILLSPVGSFFSKGFKPISLWVSQEHVRAVAGGTGEAKTGGNYAASFAISKEAKEQGFDQVLWLDAKERRYIEEAGAMNVFFVINNKLVTPALTGSILPGITRKSILEIAADLGVECEERSITIQEVVDSINNNTLSEMFCCGTAAVIVSIDKIVYNKQVLNVVNAPGAQTQKLYDHLLQLQFGEIPDTRGWIKKL